jgi:hypothetical protein
MPNQNIKIRTGTDKTKTNTGIRTKKVSIRERELRTKRGGTEAMAILMDTERTESPTIMEIKTPASVLLMQTDTVGTESAALVHLGRIERTKIEVQMGRTFQG